MSDLALLVNLVQLAIEDRTQLALENIALRHQLAVYERHGKRPNPVAGEDAEGVAERIGSPGSPGSLWVTCSVR